jgi:hypothetical protein
MKLNVLGTEAACGTSSGNGANFGTATAVRVHNSGASARLVSVETAAAALIGTFTLGVGKTEIISKASTDEVFAAHAEVLAVKVGIIG